MATNMQNFTHPADCECNQYKPIETEPKESWIQIGLTTLAFVGALAFIIVVMAIFA